MHIHNQQGGKMNHSSDDKKMLHKMGYAQELSRSMSSFSNFAISFSIICILSGGINSLAQATAGVGGGAIGIGWLVGCAISGVFALAMAQISSSFPTAGGLYHWGSILGNRFTGWVTAWFNLIGLITVLGAINVGTYYFFMGAFGATFGLEDTYQTKMVFLSLLTGVQAIINHVGIKLTAKLTDLSGYIILGTAVLLTVASFIYAQSLDFSRLWTFTNYSGLPDGASVWPKSESMSMIFLLGLLLPIYTITGYDASAHTAEETNDAARSVPKGILTSVLWSALAGWVMLSAFVLYIPNMDEAANQGWNVFFWAVGTGGMPNGLGQILFLLIFIAQFLCGLATVTSASRMIYAFARDGGLPFSNALKSVSVKFRTPVNAIWVLSILAVLFTSYAEWYFVVVSVTVIFLFISFAIPIGCGFFAIGTAKWNEMGPWNMGAVMYKFFAFLSVVAALFIFYIGVQPPSDKALIITIVFFGITGLVWVLFENRRFQGPPIVGKISAEKLKEIEERESVFKD